MISLPQIQNIPCVAFKLTSWHEHSCSAATWYVYLLLGEYRIGLQSNMFLHLMDCSSDKQVWCILFCNEL